VQTVMAELNHRVKNTLGVVQSIARRAARHAYDLSDFTSKFEQRLRAIAKANALLTRGEWEGIPLHAIVEGELFAGLAPRDQVTVRGDHWIAPPDAVLGLHMVFHEWATNAAKYGGLRSVEGHVYIR